MVKVYIPPAKKLFPLKPHHHISNLTTTKQKIIVALNSSSSTKHLYQIQAHIQISGLHKDEFIATEFVRFCASRNINRAHSFLDRSKCLTPVPWNIVIRGYSTSDSPKNAIWVYIGMKRRGIVPNNFTFPFLFKACSVFTGPHVGQQIHSDVISLGLDSDVYVNNTLIHFYGSSKKILDAQRVFDAMFVRTTVSWNSIFSTFMQNSWFDEAIRYFMKMRDCGFEPDETTMVILLSVCSELGNLNLGKLVHAQVIGKEMVMNCQLGTALVDMYAKSGDVGFAELVFYGLVEKNVWTWSAMILGLAQHGFANEALKLYRKMKMSSVRPNYVTFLGILCACSHCGLVKEGYGFFNEMKLVHGIKPMMIHYGAMVDILGRAGQLKEAYSFITDMPIEPDPIVWRTLFSACSVHGANDYEGVGDAVRRKLLELEPRRSGNFVMIANMYAEDEEWAKAAKIRRVMKNEGLKKMAGESSVDIGGFIHKFFSGDDFREDFEESGYPSLVSTICSSGCDKLQAHGAALGGTSWIAAGLCSGICKILDTRNGNTIASWRAHDAYITKVSSVGVTGARTSVSNKVQNLLKEIKKICVCCWHRVMDMAEKDETEGRRPACQSPYDKEKIAKTAENCGR